MRTVANPKPAVLVRDKTTWYYMSHRDEQLSMELDYPSFVARAGRLRSGIVTDGTPQAIDRLNESYVSTAATVIEMVEMFDQGSSMKFPDPNVAKIIYERITKHLTAHYREMQTNKMYEIPDVEVFRRMCAFALAVRPIAADFDAGIDTPARHSAIRRGMQARPRFSDWSKETEENAPRHKEIEVPKAQTKLDAIERFLAVIDGN